MTRTLTLHEAALAHIGKRLDALGLPLEIATFGNDGAVAFRGAALAPGDHDAGYLWLSRQASAAMGQPALFDAALAFRSVDVLQTYNAGLDHPFYAAIAAKGARICNSSAQGVAIAEYVFAELLAVLQPVERRRALQAERKWELTPFREISQTRWLILGHGPIGAALAHRAKAFGAAVDVVRRSPAGTADADRAGTLADLPRFLPDADIVILACPLTPETRGLAGAGFFAALKPGAILVNVARGALVETPALLAALDGGRLSTAILDVFDQEPLPGESPLWSHPGVRMTAHTSYAGDGAGGRWDALFLDNVARWARGEPLARLAEPPAG